MNDAAREVVESFGRLFETLGSGYNLGRCFGYALLAHEPVTQSQLVDALGVSQSVVSTTLRQMTVMGLLEKVRVPGSRAAHYQIPTDAAQLMVESPRRRIAMFTEVLGEASALELAPSARQRVDLFLELYSFLDKHMVDLLTQWRKEHSES